MLETIIDKVKENRIIIIGTIFLSFVLIIGIFYISGDSSTDKDQLTDLTEKTSHYTKESSSSTESSSDTYITIDIKGAVQRPGLYTVPIDSRVNDAINKAGGLTNQADDKSINLAKKLQDESVVYVAEKGESNTDLINQYSNVDNDETSASSSKININTATAEDLQKISGIGEKRAQDIIDYRTENGLFKSIDDLKNISGIGDKTLENMKDSITID